MALVYENKLTKWHICKPLTDETKCIQGHDCIIEQQVAVVTRDVQLPVCDENNWPHLSELQCLNCWSRGLWKMLRSTTLLQHIAIRICYMFQVKKTIVPLYGSSPFPFFPPSDTLTLTGLWRDTRRLTRRDALVCGQKLLYNCICFLWIWPSEGISRRFRVLVRETSDVLKKPNLKGMCQVDLEILKLEEKGPSLHPHWADTQGRFWRQVLRDRISLCLVHLPLRTLEPGAQYAGSKDLKEP